VPRCGLEGRVGRVLRALHAGQLRPLLNARELLGEREAELDEGFRAFLAAENLNDDGTLRFNGEYILAVVPR
jgi:hypothetical protein